MEFPKQGIFLGKNFIYGQALSNVRDRETLYQISKYCLWVFCFLLFVGISGGMYLYFSPYSSSSHGLSGTYYSNATCESVPYQDRILDADISHHAPTFETLIENSRQVCVEWRGFIAIPASGNRKFFTQSDDGSWLWIDEQLVVDNGGMHGLQEQRGKIDLSKGLHPIRIRYVQYGGGAVMRVLWEKENDVPLPLTSEVLLPLTVVNWLRYNIQFHISALFADTSSFLFIGIVFGITFFIGLFLDVEHYIQTVKQRLLATVPFIQKIHRQQHFIKILFIIAISLIASFYIFGENLHAKFWMIDDHEIMNFLGDDGQLHLKEIPSVILSTEVGSFGKSLRFRPMYYFLKVNETFLWGRNPFLFYLVRIVICSVFVMVLWYLLQRKVGVVLGLLLVMAIMSFEYWADIFSRLGPSEIYVTLGTALFSLGFFTYIEKLSTSIKNYFPYCCIFLGAVIAVGSKENMVLLAIPVLWILIHAYLRKRMNYFMVGTSITILLFCGLIVCAIMLSLSSSAGKNIYDENLSSTTILLNEILTLPGSFRHYFQMMTFNILKLLSIVALLLTGAFIFRSRKIAIQQCIRIFGRSCFWMIILYGIFLTQKIFYNGNWPTDMRYDFPGRLGEMLMIFILIVVSLSLGRLLESKNFLRGFQAGVGGLMLLIIWGNGSYIPLQNSAHSNVIRTTAFATYIDTIVNEASQHTNWPIIFQSYKVKDYEPILAVRSFLRSFGVKNPLMLQLHKERYTESVFGVTLADQLTAQLQQIVASGGEGFVPLIESGSHECFVIYFGGFTSNQCTHLGDIYAKPE